MTLQSQADLVSRSVFSVICEWIDPYTKSDPLTNGLTNWPITYFAGGYNRADNTMADPISVPVVRYLLMQGNLILSLAINSSFLKI